MCCLKKKKEEEPEEVGTIIVPVLQMRELSHREFKGLAQGHKVNT